MTPQVKVTAREVRRRQTRERILGAAIVEFTRSGMTRADVNTIVATAGVAHGTFFFHFPSKEHVLLELESAKKHASPPNSPSTSRTPTDLPPC
jgi:TetR/AcrR family transcriptional regulator, repressor for uid operon